ncbi:hypothetical protein, partial [Alienimonas sp. DA493]|uniref:hypothetical protein n=1 Tax=Alienimonas sp. DA493 TaxID=3373605 RepID=UPI0037542B1E
MASVFGQVFGATTGGGGGALTLPTLPSSVYVGQEVPFDAQGGTAPYVYTVDGTVVTSPWTPAAAGSYVVAVTDALGATDEQTVTAVELAVEYAGRVTASFTAPDLSPAVIGAGRLAPGESRAVGLDFSAKLGTGEELTGQPTAGPARPVRATAGSLAASGAGVTTAAAVEVPSGRGVAFLLAASDDAAGLWDLPVECNTDGGQTVAATLRVWIA